MEPMPDTDVPLPPAETVDDIVRRFLDGTIDDASWTHPAHLFVCRHLLATEPDIETAFACMRALIKVHNARVTPGGGHGAYHETVTRYFVEAVSHAAATNDAALLTDPSCRRDAPRRHWSPEVLASTAARSGWVDPDLEPLPWDPPTTSTGGG